MFIAYLLWNRLHARCEGFHNRCCRAPHHIFPLPGTLVLLCPHFQMSAPTYLAPPEQPPISTQWEGEITQACGLDMGSQKHSHHVPQGEWASGTQRDSWAGNAALTGCIVFLTIQRLFHFLSKGLALDSLPWGVLVGSTGVKTQLPFLQGPSGREKRIPTVQTLGRALSRVWAEGARQEWAGAVWPSADAAFPGGAFFTADVFYKSSSI